MEFKTYEIIELTPRVLKTNIPLIDLIALTIYYVGAPFYLLWQNYKSNISIKKTIMSLFSNKETLSFEGAESKNSVLLNLDGSISDFNPNGILKTKITFFKNDKAIELLNELIIKGFKIDNQKLSLNFIIKEKIETYDKDNNLTIPRERVFFTSPKFAEQIAIFLRIK